MTPSQAIKAVGVEIQKKDSDLYVFQPKDHQERFFIEAALVGSAATIILSAFLKGLSSVLEKRAEDLGEHIGIWMIEKLEALFRSEASPVSENDLAKDVVDVKKMITHVDIAQVAEVASQVEDAMISTFTESGMTGDRAAIIAASTRQQVVGLVGND